MKTAILLFLLSVSAFAEQTFHAREFGLLLVTPDGWQHDAKDTLGYVLRAPVARQTQKLRVHFANKEAKSVQEAAELSLKRINEVRAPKKQPLEDVLSSGPVKTRSGIEGWRSAHGFADTSEHSYIVHYYFHPPGGRIVCVCAYVMYDPADGARLRRSHFEQPQIHQTMTQPRSTSPNHVGAANRSARHGGCGRPPPPFHPPAGAAPAPPVAELEVVEMAVNIATGK